MLAVRSRVETTTNPATTFVFLATDTDGKRRYVEACADSVSAARYRLEVQGFTDISVIKDGMNAQIDASIKSDAWEGMTLEERIEFERRCAGPEANRFILWHFLKSDGLVLAGLGLWVWFRVTGDRPWGVGSFVAYACALGFLALILRIKIPAYYYTRLLEARVWHRWSEVERIVARIRGIRWFTGSLVPEHDLLFSEAKVLAAKDDLAAALAKVQPLETDGSLAPALYYGLLAPVYECAHDVAGQVEALEKALSFDPKSSNARLDLACALVLDLRNNERARAVLQELDPEDLVPMAKPHFDLVCGVLALDEGRYEDA
jgi:hypothetical protein